MKSQHAKRWQRAAEMAPLVRALTALAEGQASVPGIYIRQLYNCISSSKRFHMPFGIVLVTIGVIKCHDQGSLCMGEFIWSWWFQRNRICHHCGRSMVAGKQAWRWNSSWDLTNRRQSVQWGWQDSFLKLQSQPHTSSNKAIPLNPSTVPPTRGRVLCTEWGPFPCTPLRLWALAHVWCTWTHVDMPTHT